MIALLIGVAIAILTAVLSQAAREALLLLSGYFGPRIIRRAATALPGKRRMIREPEWLAEFQRQLDKGLAFGGLTFALGCMVGAHRVRYEAPKETPNDDPKRSLLNEAQRRLLPRLVHEVAHGGTAAIQGMWLSALIMSPFGAWLVSRPGYVGDGWLVLGTCAFYTLAGFGLLARRAQLTWRKHRTGRRATEPPTGVWT